MITHSKSPRKAIVLGAFIFGPLATLSGTQAPVPVPSVVGARVPFYPPILQKAHFDGLVRLRITTDGRRPSSIEGVDGQPMLLRAATDNIKTWEFEQHSPTVFEASFRYRLLPATCDSACNCDSTERPSVVLRLPTEVEVSATEVLTCDPVVPR